MIDIITHFIDTYKFAELNVSSKLDYANKVYDFLIKMITMLSSDREYKIYYTALLDCGLDIVTCIITSSPNEPYPTMKIDKKLIGLLQTINNIQDDMNDNYHYLERRRRRVKRGNKKHKSKSTESVADNSSTCGSDE
jgi:hypothetical protein